MSDTGSRYLQIIREIIQSPSNRIGQTRYEEILNVARANIYIHTKRLCNGEDAILSKIKNHNHIKGENDKYYYTLKGSVSDIEGLSKETLYFLEAYKHMGYLLDSAVDEIPVPDNKVKKKELEQLQRKFFYLSKVQAKGFDEHIEEWLKQIVSALLTHKQIVLWYPSKNDPHAEHRREVRPLSLCQYRDDLYLLGYEYKHETEGWEVRSYKISRIDNFEENETTFKYPPKNKWDPADRYKWTSGLICQPDGGFKEAEIKVYGDFKNILDEKYFMGARKQVGLCTEEYDFYIFNYTNFNEFIGQLFTYAECVEIVGPKELKTAFRTKALKALQLNFEPTAPEPSDPDSAADSYEKDEKKEVK